VHVLRRSPAGTGSLGLVPGKVEPGGSGKPGADPVTIRDLAGACRRRTVSELAGRPAPWDVLVEELRSAGSLSAAEDLARLLDSGDAGVLDAVVATETVRRVVAAFGRRRYREWNGYLVSLPGFPYVPLSSAEAFERYGLHLMVAADPPNGRNGRAPIPGQGWRRFRARVSRKVRLSPRVRKALILPGLVWLALAAAAPAALIRRIRARLMPPRPHAILLLNGHALGLDRGEIVDQAFVDDEQGWALEIAVLRHGSAEDVLQAVSRDIFRMRYRLSGPSRTQLPRLPGPGDSPAVALAVGFPGEMVPGTDVPIGPGQTGLRFGIRIHAGQMKRAGLVPPAWRSGYLTNRDLEVAALLVAAGTIPGSAVLAWFTVQATHMAHGAAGTVAGVAIAALTSLVMSWTWYLMIFGLAMDASPHHEERPRQPVRAFIKFLLRALVPLVSAGAALVFLIGLAGEVVSHL